MAVYKIIELDYDLNGAPDYYPHHLEVDGQRVLSDESYNNVLKYVQRNLQPTDTVIEQYHAGSEVTYTGKKFLIAIPHIWKYMK